MAPTRRTWLWVLAAVLGLGVVFIIAMAGFGVYFVSNNVRAGQATASDAFKQFDEARAPFGDQPAVFELDERERPKQLREFSSMPTGEKKAETMWILVWDPDRERIVRVSMPFWVLRLGRQKIDIAEGGFDFQSLQLDVAELERVGPVLLFDLRRSAGERVLVWTQ
jgi:hypothetical protein